jgi:hypothetical protein
MAGLALHKTGSAVTRLTLNGVSESFHCFKDVPYDRPRSLLGVEGMWAGARSTTVPTGFGLKDEPFPRERG